MRCVNLQGTRCDLKKILIYGLLKLFSIEKSIYQYFISQVLHHIFLD